MQNKPIIAKTEEVNGVRRLKVTESGLNAAKAFAATCTKQPDAINLITIATFVSYIQNHPEK